MRVLLTGASGFIGAHVARRLAESGLQVVGFSRSAPPSWAGLQRWIAGDVTDPAALDGAARGCAAIVHCAALYSYARSAAGEMHRINLTGTRNVCEAAVRQGVPRLLLTSSATTCGPVPGRPATEADLPTAEDLTISYRRSKLDAERLAVSYVERGLEVVVVNPTTVVGPGDHRPTPSGSMIRGVVDGRIRAYLLGAGLNVVGVQDVAAGHQLALDRGRSGERYILGGDDLHLRDVFAVVAEAVDRPAPRIGVPWVLPFALARCTDRIGRATGRESRLLLLDEVKLARWPLFFSSEKARHELGYRPAPPQDALAQAARWFALRPATPIRSRAIWTIRSPASGRASISGGDGGD